MTWNIIGYILFNCLSIYRLFNLIYKSQICTSSTKIALFELFTKGLIWPTHALMVKLADLKL